MANCGDNEALNALKAKQGELDSLLAAGKEQLGAMESKLNAMKADLESFKPEIPEVTRFQDELDALAAFANDPLGFAAKKLELQKKFGDAIPDMDDILGKLGLSEFPPKLPSIKDICDAVPNVELDAAGKAEEKPEPPKVADVVPEPPPVKPPVEVDQVELNKKLIKRAYKNSFNYMNRGASRIFAGWGAKKKNKMFFDSTFEEMMIEVIEAGGGDYNELKVHPRTKEELRADQKALSSKYPNANWDFKKEGQILKETYDLLKGNWSHYSQASDFQTSAAEYNASRKVKLANKNNEITNY